MNPEQVKKINQLAENLKKNGLANSMSDAVEKAKEIILGIESMNVPQGASDEKIEEIKKEMNRLEEDLSNIGEELDVKVKKVIEDIKRHEQGLDQAQAIIEEAITEEPIKEEATKSFQKDETDEVEESIANTQSLEKLDDSQIKISDDALTEQASEETIDNQEINISQPADNEILNNLNKEVIDPIKSNKDNNLPDIEELSDENLSDIEELSDENLSDIEEIPTNDTKELNSESIDTEDIGEKGTEVIPEEYIEESNLEITGDKDKAEGNNETISDEDIELDKDLIDEIPEAPPASNEENQNMSTKDASIDLSDKEEKDLDALNKSLFDDQETGKSDTTEEQGLIDEFSK